MHWTGRVSKMNLHTLLVLALTLLAGGVYPAKSLPSQEQRLNNEQGASPDIEESKVLLEELEELLDEEMMTNNNGGEDEMALLSEKRHSVPTDDCLLKTTHLTSRYRWNVPQLTGRRFTFQVSALDDARIALSSVNRDAFDMYEIIIGGWGNTKSAIRRKWHGPNLVLVPTPGINSPTEFRTFWIDWALDGTISVGKGFAAQPFMSWRDPNPLQVSYAGYSTRGGSTGRWKFCPTRDQAISDQAIFTDPNVASGRPTHQSSTMLGGVPARAVDGKRSPEWLDHSCTHTIEQNDPWWYVDLGRSVTIDHVAIVNRRDCCSDDITPFEVHVGSSTDVFRNPRCGGHHRFPPSDTEKVVHCGGLKGRYVGIRLPGRKRSLMLCEVEVYAAPNLALGKHAFQSNVTHNGFAYRATDGCRDTNWGSYCCTNTPAEANWLEVDLGTSVEVQWVVIMYRANFGVQLLTPFTVHIGNGVRVDHNPLCGGHHIFPAGRNKHVIYCNGGLTGRYVGIRLPGYGRTLTVCEIEVYAGAVTKRTSEVRETEGKACGEHEDGQSWVGDEEEHNCNCDAGEEFCYKVECGDDGEKKPIKGEEGMWTCEETEETEETAREFPEETMENGMEDYNE